MKMFLNLIISSVLFVSITANNLVEVVTAVQRHFRSGCVYLLHAEKDGKPIFTFLCQLLNSPAGLFQETGRYIGSK
jgi:hypothetical protein